MKLASHLLLILIVPVVLMPLAHAASPLQMSLPAAVDRALSANRSLASATMLLEGERYSVDAARAEFEPKIGPAVTVGRTGNSALFPNGGGQNNSYGILVRKKYEMGTAVYAGPSYNRAANTSNTTMNVALSQPLLKGAGAEVNLDGVHRAEFSVKSSTLKMEQTKISTVLETVTTFYEANRQRRIIELYQSLCEKLRQHVAITRNKEKTGLVGSMDTYRAEISLKEAEDALSQTGNGYLTSIGKLKYLLSLGQDADIDLVLPAPPLLKIEDPEIDAEISNIELAQAQAELEEAERAVRVAGDATLPEINLQLSYGQANRSDPFVVQYLPTTYQTWNVSLQSSSDLFRTAEKNNYYRARVTAEMMRVNLQQKKDDIKRQTRLQVSYISASRERSALRIEQIKQAEGKLALAEVKFRNGMADNFSIIETEAELQNARIGLLTEEADYAISVYKLAAITGHLFDGALRSQSVVEHE